MKTRQVTREIPTGDLTVLTRCPCCGRNSLRMTTRLDPDILMWRDWNCCHCGAVGTDRYKMQVRVVRREPVPKAEPVVHSWTFPNGSVLVLSASEEDGVKLEGCGINLTVSKEGGVSQ